MIHNYDPTGRHKRCNSSILYSTVYISEKACIAQGIEGLTSIQEMDGWNSNTAYLTNLFHD